MSRKASIFTYFLTDDERFTPEDKEMAGLGPMSTHRHFYELYLGEILLEHNIFLEISLHQISCLRQHHILRGGAHTACIVYQIMPNLQSTSH